LNQIEINEEKIQSKRYSMSEKKKLKKLQSKVELLESLMGAPDNFFSTNYLMKMLNLERNEVRKNKINKLFNDETREI